jgi:chromosome partitioning protein
MGVIVAVGSSKGGVGKSAACQIMVPNMIQRGWRVAVVDADQNGTFSRWHSDAFEGTEFTCLHEPHEVRAVDAAQRLLDEGVDVVFVDTAGFKNLTAATAMAAADLVIIPCMSDRGSVMEAIATYEQVQGLARASRRKIPAYTLCTRWRGKGLAERAALEGLKANGVPVLVATLSDLADIAKLTHSGRVPTSGKAAMEADRITDELVALGILPPLPKSRRTMNVSGAPNASMAKDTIVDSGDRQAKTASGNRRTAA